MLEVLHLPDSEILVAPNAYVAGNGSFGGAGAVVRTKQPQSALAPDEFFAGMHSSSAMVSVDVPFIPARVP